MTTFSSESRRIPFSTPETVEMVTTTAASTISAAWTPRVASMSNSRLSPKETKTAPMPRVVAIPKTVPTTAAVCTVSPAAPWARLPMIGYSALLTDSGR